PGRSARPFRAGDPDLVPPLDGARPGPPGQRAAAPRRPRPLLLRPGAEPGRRPPGAAALQQPPLRLRPDALSGAADRGGGLPRAAGLSGRRAGVSLRLPRPAGALAGAVTGRRTYLMTVL